MTVPSGTAARNLWADACLATRLVAVDPTLGVTLHGPPGPARDHWLDGLRGHLPEETPWRKLGAGTPPGRLIGGLDMAATLSTGRMVASPGLLEEADGGLLLVMSAERLDGILASRICRALDTGSVEAERDGMTGSASARIGVVALDDGRGDEGAPAALRDRLAIRLDLSDLTHRGCGPIPPEPAAMAAARARLPGVAVEPEVVEALCAASEVLGIASLRAPIAALQVARASAALAGRATVQANDVSAAARLVLGPRATRMPAVPPDSVDDAPTAPEAEAPEPVIETSGLETSGTEGASPDTGDGGRRPDVAGEGAAMAVAAATSALPADLLASLTAGAAIARGAASGARRGGAAAPGRQGRPIGSRRGDPGRDARLDVLATLRAGAPWQALRGRVAVTDPVRLRRDDFRVRRLRDRQRTTTIFAVDASGSAALNRLAEAKGAVELLLAECYIRRDDVALVAFRGREAEVLLSPTRSPARAKRELANLPGGGATPLAAGLDATLDLARLAARAGRRPVVAVLTDGRGNVARDGTIDRVRATEDGHASARALRAVGVVTVVIDVSPRPGPAAARLAAEMGATYLPLPLAAAHGIAQAVATAARAVAP